MCLQIEQKMANQIAEEEEKRMFSEMNEAELLKAEQRCVGIGQGLEEKAAGGPQGGLSNRLASRTTCTECCPHCC